MRIVAIAARTVRWSIAGTGAARGRGARAAVLVEVRGDRGELGVGEAAPLPGFSRDGIADVEREIAALPVPFEIANVADALSARCAGAAQFAIETALLDAWGRAHGLSIAQLLCAAPAARVPLAAVVDSAQDVQRALAAGIRTLKVKHYPGDELRVIPGDILLRVDGNRQWPPERLEELLAPLRRPGIDYIEEPCADMLRVLDAPADFALDESLAELAPEALRRALAHRHVVAAVLKPTVLGGFAAALQLAQLARSLEVAPVVTHALEGPIATAACAELARAVMMPAPPDLQDASIRPRPRLARAAGLAPHPALAGWRLAVPQLAGDHVRAAGPGLGLGALDLETAVRAAPEPA